MNNSKKDLIEIILLGAILIVLVIILALTGIKTKMENSNKLENSDNLFGETNNNEEDNVNKDDVESDNEIDNDYNSSDNEVNNSQNNNSFNNASDDKEEINNNNNGNSGNNEVKPNDKDNENSNVIDTPNKNESSNITDNKNESVDINEGENAVISYLSNLDNKLDTYNNENDKTLREKAKDIFVTTVDFLFYDGVIKGYTFDELSLSAKLKALKIIASIDNKIDKYFPNYKDTIKEKATNFKGKIAVLYLETTSEFCAKVGEDSCNEARTDFNNMKTSFGYTWSILKEVLTTSKDKLSLVLSEWYKSIK